MLPGLVAYFHTGDQSHGMLEPVLRNSNWHDLSRAIMPALYQAAHLKETREVGIARISHRPGSFAGHLRLIDMVMRNGQIQLGYKNKPPTLL